MVIDYLCNSFSVITYLTNLICLALFPSLFSPPFQVIMTPCPGGNRWVHPRQRLSLPEGTPVPDTIRRHPYKVPRIRPSLRAKTDPLPRYQTWVPLHRPVWHQTWQEWQCPTTLHHRHLWPKTAQVGHVPITQGWLFQTFFLSLISQTVIVNYADVEMPMENLKVTWKLP